MKQIAILLAGLFLLQLAAVPSAAATDVPGGKDHPLITRYQGSVLIGCETRDYEAMVVPLGKTRRDPAGNKAFTGSETVEGKLTRLLYVAPAGVSSLEVYRNYRDALAGAGAEFRFECKDDGCGPYMAALVYPKDRVFRNGGQRSEYAFAKPREQRFLAARIIRGGGSVDVNIYTAVNEFNLFKDTYQRAITLVEILESADMRTDMVTVDADAMAAAIDREGRIALYGITFATDSADIRPESKQTMAEIARFLKARPAQKIFVVGHTDTTGGLVHNMDLSTRRAEAVVRVLVRDYAIAAERLSAHGVGPLCPRDVNTSKEGRGRNRRVELVGR